MALLRKNYIGYPPEHQFGLVRNREWTENGSWKEQRRSREFAMGTKPGVEVPQRGSGAELRGVWE